jgi:hypothetical protein
MVFSLGGGYEMTHEGFGVWKVRDSTGELAATFVISYYTGSEVPALSDAHAFVRGVGLGRRALSVLVRHYGELRSSHTGNTSDEAQKMWESLNPRVSWDSEDLNASKFGGSKRTRSYYYLTKKMLEG